MFPDEASQFGWIASFCDIIEATQGERNLTEIWRSENPERNTVFRLPPFLFFFWLEICNSVLSGVAVTQGSGVTRQNGSIFSGKHH